MHWVDRGPEPERLAPIRADNTPRWVAYYPNRLGARPPSDSHWRGFHDELERAFSKLCAYCEERCKGEVDHFLPKSRFPESVYAWSNWVFACHDCNHAKGDKWPPDGYVDPCAIPMPDRPENFFDFDTETGEILPKQSLSPTHREKAQRMLTDLRLNDRHHLKKRREWILMVSGAITDNPANQTSDSEHLGKYLALRSTQWSSISRAWLEERGYSLDD